NMQRKLRTLADGTTKQRESDDSHHRRPDRHRSIMHYIATSRGAGKQDPQARQRCISNPVDKEPKSDQEPEISHAIGEKSFDGSVTRRVLLVPETDQQI